MDSRIFEDDDPTDLKFHKIGRRVTDIQASTDDKLQIMSVSFSDLRLEVKDHIAEEAIYRQEETAIRHETNEVLRDLASAMQQNTLENAKQREDINKLLTHMEVMRPVEQGVVWIRISGRAAMVLGALSAGSLSIWAFWEKFFPGAGS